MSDIKHNITMHFGSIESIDLSLTVDERKKEIIEQIELLSNLTTVIEDLTFKVNILRIALIVSILNILILLVRG